MKYVQHILHKESEGKFIPRWNEVSVSISYSLAAILFNRIIHYIICFNDDKNVSINIYILRKSNTIYIHSMYCHSDDDDKLIERRLLTHRTLFKVLLRVIYAYINCSYAINTNYGAVGR